VALAILGGVVKAPEGTKRQLSVEATKRRIREAAIAEFAAYGQHGTTMERIAARAGVNKERIYAYFGDKAALFTAILREELKQVVAAVPLTIERMEDVAEFGGRLFDYHEAHPHLARLVYWEGLADVGAVPEEASRSALYRQRVDALAAAQRAGVIDDCIDPAHFSFLLLALVNWWSASPQTARMLTGADPADPDERARRRAAVVHAAQRLAQPQSPAGGAA
jgi:AcrR family transcriptional regulator